MENEICIRVENASVRFNMASEKVNNLKEYVIKLIHGQVKYDEFFPDHIYRALQLGELEQTAFSKYYLCRKYSF